VFALCDRFVAHGGRNVTAEHLVDGRAGAVLRVGPQVRDARDDANLGKLRRGRMSIVGQAREVAERFFERFGAGDLDGALELFAPDCIALTPSGPLDNRGHLRAAQALKRALPDSSMDVLRVLELDDEVYVTGRFKGTHEADLVTPLGTVPASGRHLDLLFVDYFRVVDGHIVECEAVRDRLDMILQLDGPPKET